MVQPLWNFIRPIALSNRTKAESHRFMQTRGGHFHCVLHALNITHRDSTSADLHSGILAGSLFVRHCLQRASLGSIPLAIVDCQTRRCCTNFYQCLAPGVTYFY